MREAQVMGAFTGMAVHRAKHAKEMRKLMADLEQRAIRVLEVTGKPIDTRHAQSVLISIVDTDTMKHMAQHIRDGAEEKDYTMIKAKIFEFANMVDNSVVVKDDLKAVTPAEGKFISSADRHFTMPSKEFDQAAFDSLVMMSRVHEG